MNEPLDALPNYLPSVPEPMYGIQQQAPAYYQGTDICINAQLCVNGAQVSPNDYTLAAILKKDLSSNCFVWNGTLNVGIEVNNGVTQVKIPLTVTTTLPSGTYYLTIVGTPNYNRNSLVVLFNQTISIVPSAASPLPIQPGAVEGIPMPIFVVVDPSADTSTITVPINYF